MEYSRYHAMNEEEKRVFNRKRTKMFHAKRLEEEVLLSTPAKKITEDALKKVTV